MTTDEVEELSYRRPGKSSGKKNQFDVKGLRVTDDTGDLNAEDALLIDPTREEPSDHLTWNFTTELTIIEPKSGSDYGEYTIRVCALNRAALVLARIPPLRVMRSIRTKIMEGLSSWSGSESELKLIMSMVQVLKEHANPDQPYSGMAAEFIARFDEELAAWLAANGIRM
jgi:hypothetical protein